MRECVATIRRLQTLGVRVFFEKEGIDTSEPRNELLFHLMATIAEEESNSIGRNLMTAHEMRNRSGNPFWQRKYGYKKGANGEWIPDERPAAKVRSAFCMACAGYSVGSIRRMLIRMEDADPSGKKWYAVDVSMLLRNVLYKGDYLTQKTIRNADGTGRTKNRGEREQYYLEGHHTPLVPPEVFDHVQRLLESKTLWENRRNVSPEQRALLEEGKRLSEEYGLYAVIRDNPYVEETPCIEGKASPQQSQRSDTAPDKEPQENDTKEDEDGKVQ